MAEAKHTPGPWTASKAFNGLVYVYDSTKRTIARVLRVGGDLSAAEQAANAYLFAAAPELLAVATLLVEANCPEAVAFATQRAHAAIAKATGSASHG